MVVLQGDDRFYIRNSGGKHRMDVGEVRTAFNLSQEAGERIRRFQAERVGRIRADAAPLPLMSEPKVVLHIIPLNYSNVSQSYDVGQARRSNQKLKPMFESIRDYRFNADGVVEYSWRKDKNISTSYTQLFRSGAIEAVAVAGAHNEISPESVENEVGGALLNYLPVLESLGVDLPLVTLVSILDGKGASFFGNNIPTRTSFNSQSYGLDRDVIHLPDVLLQSYDPDIAESLQPIFDALWQSGGYSGSPRYR